MGYVTAKLNTGKWGTSDRRVYYDCFGAYYCDGNATPVVQLVADYVEEQLETNVKVLEECVV